MALLGITPGPVVGEAYRFLLELRLDEGPIGPDAATERLRAWWAAARGRRLRAPEAPRALASRLVFGRSSPADLRLTPPPRSITCERVTFRRFEGLERDSGAK